MQLALASLGDSVGASCRSMRPPVPSLTGSVSSASALHSASANLHDAACVVLRSTETVDTRP